MNAPEKIIEAMHLPPSAILTLSQEEQRRQRLRSLTIALALGALAVIFFAVTIVRLGSNIINQPV